MSKTEQPLDPCAISFQQRPDGGPSNFTNPQSLRTTVIAVTSVTAGLAVIIATGRLFANRRMLKAADYVMFVAVIFDLALMGLLLSTSKFFRHSWDVPACWVDVTYVKLTLATIVLVGPVLSIPKISIFLFYLQIFSIRKCIRIGVKIGLVLTFLAFYPTSLVLIYFYAPHVGETWEEFLAKEVQCSLPGIIVIGVGSVLVDLYIFILPLPVLYKLNMALSKRIQLAALFCTAFMGIVASVVCLVYRIKLFIGTDRMWDTANMATVALVENNIAIIVGSLPAFASFLRLYVAEKPTFRLLMSTLRGHSKTESQRSGSYKNLDWDQQHPRQCELLDAERGACKVAVEGQAHTPETALTR